MARKIRIKDKLLNFLLVRGNKETTEKILLKSVKELQKSSKKQTLNIIKTAIALSIPAFTVFKLTNKRKKKKRNKQVRIVPAFISNKESRKALALKFIAKITDKKRDKMHLWLKNEFILNAKNLGFAAQAKLNLQKEAISYRRIFKYYKWK